MRKILMTIGGLLALMGMQLFSSNSAMAQETQDTVVSKTKKFVFYEGGLTDGFRFGIHVSPTIGTFNAEDNLISDKSRGTLSYGIIFDKYLFGKERYAFSTGINIVNKGGTLKNIEPLRFSDAWPNDTLSAATNIKLKLRYWEIPFIFRLRTNPIKEKFVGYAQFGWINGFRTRSRAEIGGSEELKFRKETRFFNFGLNFGLGTEYQLSETTTAMIGLSFNRSITSALRDHDRAEANHVSLTIGIFY